MPIAQNDSSVFGRRKKASTTAARTGFTYPLQDPDDRIFQLVGFTLVEDKTYGKERFDFKRVKATMVLLAPGDAEDAEDQEAMRALAHGKWFSIECDPSATPPGTNPRNGESYRASNLYEMIRYWANNGRKPDPFTQLGIVDEDDAEQMDALRAWTKAYNQGKDAEDRITDQDEAMARYAAAAVTKTLNDIEAIEPKIQLKGFLDLHTSGQGNEYNKIKGVPTLVKGDSRLPVYKALPKAVDPEAANDDPNVKCDVCGEQSHGYRRRTDGVWVGNVAAAELSKKSNGGLVVCGKCIWAHSPTNPDNHGKQKPFTRLNAAPVEDKPAKPAAKPAARPAATRAPARNVPQTVDEDEDLPF